MLGYVLEEIDSEQSQKNKMILLELQNKMMEHLFVEIVQEEYNIRYTQKLCTYEQLNHRPLIC